MKKTRKTPKKMCSNCLKPFTPETPDDRFCPECLKLFEELEENKTEAYNESQHEEAIELPPVEAYKPYQIKQYLDQYVVGQEEAKKILAIALYNHAKRINLIEKNPELEIDKSNVIIAGPSGCGKTHLIKHLAKLFRLPYCIVDATCLTESGYVGADCEVCLQKLYYAADENVRLAERGIIFIDEIDKKAGKQEVNNSITRDVSGEGVQQALLKMIEGSKVDVQLTGERRNPYQETVTIDTANILFVFSGAFPGIEKIITKRLEPNSEKKIHIGYKPPAAKKDYQSYNELIQHLTSQDLQKYGLIPEFIGRIPVICPIEQLDEGQLVKILTEPKNSIIKQYQMLMQEDGITLEFTEAALNEIAKAAIMNKTGARGLRTQLEQLLREPMFEIGKTRKNRLVIDEEYIKKFYAKETLKLKSA